MSEWIDFLVYAVLILLFWILLPRHARHFTLPMLADRNPEWLARHRDVAARIERSRWFLNACYIWGAASLAVMLGVTLDLIEAPFVSAAPKWEVLKDLNSVLLLVGVLPWSACALFMLYWIGTHVPLAATRSATLKPRVLSDYLSWPWRVGIEILTALHLGTWVVIGLLGLAGGAKYWSGFVFIAAMSILFAAMAALTPRRRPGYLDRLFGDRYRRVELRMSCVLRLAPVIAGGMLIGEQAFGIDPDRVGHLLLVSLIDTMLLMALGLRPVSPGGGTLTAEPRLTA